MVGFPNKNHEKRPCRKKTLCLEARPKASAIGDPDIFADILRQINPCRKKSLLGMKPRLAKPRKQVLVTQWLSWSCFISFMRFAGCCPSCLPLKSDRKTLRTNRQGRRCCSVLTTSEPPVLFCRTQPPLSRAKFASLAHCFLHFAAVFLRLAMAACILSSKLQMVVKLLQSSCE